MIGSYFDHVLQTSERVQTVQIQVIVRHVYDRQILEVDDFLYVREISDRIGMKSFRYETDLFVRKSIELHRTSV